MAAAHRAIVRALHWLCLFASLAPAWGGEPRVDERPDGWQVVNAHYTAVVSRKTGGLLASLTDSAGQRLIARFDVYTDAGFYAEREYYGTGKEPTPRVDIARKEGKLVVTSEGRLACSGEGQSEYPSIRYRVQLTFDASTAIGVSMRLVSDVEGAPRRAFLAHAVGLADAAETFVATADGLLCRDAARRAGRTWGSVHAPLAATRPVLGACTKTRTCLAFTHLRSLAGLANVFFHESGMGQATVFFAWHDGPMRAALHKGAAYDLAYTLHVVGVPEGVRNLLRAGR